MRILIVGGGVAGLTLAAKLRQQGRQPVVVEQFPEYANAGYAIGLYPLGSFVLHGLGVYEELLARGVESRRYEMLDHGGRLLQALDLSLLSDNTGPMVMLPRSELIGLLRQACGDLPIRMGATVESIDQSGGVVHVGFNDGTTGEFDLLVACDGIHSRVRDKVFGPPEVFDTGWTIWTWWAREGLLPQELVREYWCPGFLFGAYPVVGRCMCAVGLSNGVLADPHAPAETVRSVLASTLAELMERVKEVRLALEDATTLYAWPMLDKRAHQWCSGRVALCGDAATAFLPTAGIGASNALRSAAALADELSKAGAAHVPLALELYVKRCQQLVRHNQDDSRAVARYMFVKSKALCWGRDQMVKHFPATRLIKQIIQSMREPF